MPPQLSDDDLDALADRLTDPVAAQVASNLDSGWYGENLVLDRRRVLQLGALGLSASGLMALGVDEATAQSAAGQVGTSSEPVDVFAGDLDVAGALQSDLDAGGQAISNVGSLSAENTTITSATDGETTVIEMSPALSNATRYRMEQPTTGVSTTATAILQPESAISAFIQEARLTVFGTDADSASTRFVDEVAYTRGGSADDTVLTTNNNPSSRSYSLDADVLELSMSAETYNVYAVGTVLNLT